MPGEEFKSIHQVSVVPFQRDAGPPRFCLITTGRRGRWGFPKGRIGNKHTLSIAALCEAYEEAGLHGAIVDERLGDYTYRKSGIHHRVTVQLMRVSRADEHWLEQDRRQRAWFDAETARELLTRKRLRRMLELAHERISLLAAGDMSLARLYPSVNGGAEAAADVLLPERG